MSDKNKYSMVDEIPTLEYIGEEERAINQSIIDSQYPRASHNREVYTLQLNVTYQRENALKENVMNSVRFFIFHGAMILLFFVNYLFYTLNIDSITVKGIIALVHYVLGLGITLSSLIIIPVFFINFLKQYYLYGVLTEKNAFFSWLKLEHNMISLKDERYFLENKIWELDDFDKKGKQPTNENVEFLQKYSEFVDYHATSTVERSAISKWWLMAGVFLSLFIGLATLFATFGGV